ncbi:probable beta-D-xylosidase 6 [Tanacetum coccineum]
MADTLFKDLRIQHKVTEQDMQDTYQPPFKSCILQGKASCVMSSYKAVNGIPTCADQKLLQKTSTEWGFIRYQNYTKIPEDVVALALKVGLCLTLQMDTNRGTYMLRHTKSAVDKGEVKEEVIDKALLNLFEFQLFLGLFDGDPIKGKSPVQSNKHSRRPKEIFKKTTFSSGCVDATCTSNDGFNFPRDTSCGRDELHAKHLMDYLSGVVVAMSADIVDSITQVVNLFFMGNAKKKLGEYIASAPLSLLVNPGGGMSYSYGY